MPVARSGIQCAPAQFRLIKFTDHIAQPDNPSQYVQCMGDGQQVEERTAGIGREVKPFPRNWDQATYWPVTKSKPSPRVM